MSVINLIFSSNRSQLSFKRIKLLLSNPGDQEIDIITLKSDF